MHVQSPSCIKPVVGFSSCIKSDLELMQRDIGKLAQLELPASVESTCIKFVEKKTLCCGYHSCIQAGRSGFKSWLDLPSRS